MTSAVRYFAALLLLYFLLVAGCASLAGCRTAIDMPEFRLTEIKVVELEGIPTRVGRFEVKNTLTQDLNLQGWAKEPGFFVEYPASRIQLRTNRWTDVTPMIGSFMSSGEDKATIRSGESRVLLARVDFGVPAGRHEGRVVVQTIEGACLLSRPFRLDVP